MGDTAAGALSRGGFCEEEEGWRRGAGGQVGVWWGRWRWEYDMDLVRRYDLPWGLGRYRNGEEEEEDGYLEGDSEITTKKLLVFVLQDFAHLSGMSHLKNQTVGNDSPSSHLVDISPLFSNLTNPTSR